MPTKSKLVNRGPAGLLFKTKDGRPGKLVNRGPAGLLTRPKKEQFPFGANAADGNGKDEEKSVQPQVPAGKKNNINPALKAFIIDIEKLNPDPMNARLHPERNIQAVKDSLNLYGQRSLLVVRKEGMVVAKGNGTMEAAKQLGWTKIAATVQPMTDVEFHGYALADNRSAELARWDLEVVASIEKLQHEAGLPVVGWSSDEVLALRANLEGYVPIQGADGEQGWEELWQGMPEFDQQDLTSARHLVVHFRREGDFLVFLRKIGQTPSDVRQKSIWFPKAKIDKFADKRYAAKAGKDVTNAKKGR
jgi:ParB-like nuclease domain